MKKKKLIIWSSVIIVAAAIISIIVLSGNKKSLNLNTTAVKSETIELSVMATGYIQPVEVVEVGTQVSGVINKIYVDYNSYVKEGQLLAELDKLTLQEQLTQANSTLESSRSEVQYAEQNYNRVKQLHEAKAATDASLEEATNRLAQARSSLGNAQATANQARVNLNYAYVYSPINGVILDRQVNVGQTVAASFSTPTLFKIAEDLTKMQVEVNVDEADIGGIRIGQQALFTVDAYNEDYFEGTVQQIRLQPTVTSNVVTYTVIVEAPNPEEKLFPGMTANITIMVDSQKGLTVPMEALNFKPTEEVIQQINKAGISLVQEAMAQTINPSVKIKNETHTVWVKKGDSMEQRHIETGINDGINTIVKSGLNDGEEVILSGWIGKKHDNSSAGLNSLMPGSNK